MLKELFDLKKQYLNHFFENLDLQKTDQILQKLHDCKGLIFFSGIGKSGLVAKKIAVTMTSTGTQALYLSPTNAMHGDIGIVSEKDVFVLLSKSGESDELMALVPYIRNKGAYLIGVVSDPKSRLAQACNTSITLPLEKELCPFGLAPTTSSSIQLIFGDVLAVALMRMKNFSLDQYAMNHPAGRIGKRISMKVKDLMLSGNMIPVCGPKDSLMDTLVELSNKRCGCVLVIDEDKRLLGIFTDGDLRRTLQNLGSTALNSNMEAVMTKSPKFTGPNVLAWDAMKVMEAVHQKEITVLPVIDDDRTVLGVIKLHDILQAGI